MKYLILTTIFMLIGAIAFAQSGISSLTTENNLLRIQNGIRIDTIWFNDGSFMLSSPNDSLLTGKIIFDDGTQLTSAVSDGWQATDSTLIYQDGKVSILGNGSSGDLFKVESESPGFGGSVINRGFIELGFEPDTIGPNIIPTGKITFGSQFGINTQPESYIKSLLDFEIQSAGVGPTGGNIRLHTLSINDALYIKNFTGQVGINTASPAYQLDVNGDARVDSLTTNKIIFADNSELTTAPVSAWANSGGVLSYTGGVTIDTTYLPSGYSMAINGNLLAEQVDVGLSENWPDYVFTEEYKLRSLEETQEFISKHKHLPGVPSADDMEEEGKMDLGKMNLLLLEKVEELTLHLIQQNELLKEVREENELLSRKVEGLESRLD